MKLLKLAIAVSALIILTSGCKKDGTITAPGPNKTIKKSVDGNGVISVFPAQGINFSAVTITGSNFNPTTDGNIVRFNGVAAKIISATTTQIIATVPYGAVTGKVSVTTGATTNLTSADFKVLQMVKEAAFTIPAFNGSLKLAFDKNGTGSIYAFTSDAVYKVAPGGGVSVFYRAPQSIDPGYKYQVSAVETGYDGAIYAAVTRFQIATYYDPEGGPPTQYYAAQNGFINRLKFDGTLQLTIGQVVPNVLNFADGNFSTAILAPIIKMQASKNENALYLMERPDVHTGIVWRKVIVTAVQTIGNTNLFYEPTTNFGPDNNIYGYSANQLVKISTSNVTIPIVGVLNYWAGFFPTDKVTIGFGQTFLAIDDASNVFMLVQKSYTDAKQSLHTQVAIINTAADINWVDAGGVNYYSQLFADRIANKLYIVTGNSITRYGFK